MAMTISLTLLFLVLAAPAAFAVQHTVGGSSGWAQSVNYVSWAGGQTFNVGDTLLFSYTSTHSVDIVSQSDYTNCNTGNPLNTYSGGTTTISLNSTGSMYFICPTAGHCQGGMKLMVNVTAATITPSNSPPGTPSPPPPPSTTSSSPPPPPPSSAASSTFGGMNWALIEIALFVVVMVGYMG